MKFTLINIFFVIVISLLLTPFMSENTCDCKRVYTLADTIVVFLSLTLFVLIGSLLDQLFRKLQAKRLNKNYL
ncbi:MAG: hypothetical protein ACXACY_10265 [Candidatus Hodarchaeales archaeon]|jgi:uncharacterized oligopeptide transporter (OPT) family protein